MKKFLQAYLACITFVDDQVGVILDTLEKVDSKTILLLFLPVITDGKWAEKNYLFKKFTLGRKC